VARTWVRSSSGGLKPASQKLKTINNLQCRRSAIGHRGS
jgi:hypothetical protein